MTFDQTEQTELAARLWRAVAKAIQPINADRDHIIFELYQQCGLTNIRMNSIRATFRVNNRDTKTRPLDMDATRALAGAIIQRGNRFTKFEQPSARQVGALIDVATFPKAPLDDETVTRLEQQLKP